MSVAAVGAALAAAVDVTTHHAHISDLYMGVIVAVSVVLYTSCIWILTSFSAYLELLNGFILLLHSLFYVFRLFVITWDIACLRWVLSIRYVYSSRINLWKI